MRISVPHIPQASLLAKASGIQYSREEAVERLYNFFRAGKTTVLTGAGVSVDSGIRAYRGPDGRYMNPNYKPIFYHELVDETEKGRYFRQRYWLRSYLGYPPVRDAQPNPTHFALASLQQNGDIPNIITQNVDGLHHKALILGARQSWPAERLEQSILELHGTLHGHVLDRGVFQDMLSQANPQWHKFAQEMETGKESRPRTNPDGDIAIEHLGISYQDFIVPACPTCLSEGHHNSVHKPEVVFFGESIKKEVRERSYHDIESADQLLLIGTTVATYSAFRLVKHALELKKPAILLNVGPTRADLLPNLEKINMASGSVLIDVAKLLIGTRMNDPVLEAMLRSGVVNPPTPDDDDRAPRAAG
ncbi:hypothetical protein D9611_012484 [Ephemerocybe angulata]|uniref:Deacetylase sirtuin-type domain-containing protein n=1 Tax=Ephemerocybe angulata TaxID=980116 RepID=A0A8H5FIU0_9AGAR|nr:hypothetical protein D9611_012484 [Tulosesus angulatus]